jgi:hypothetical protein
MNSWINTLTEVKTATQAVPPENIPNNEPVTCTEDSGVMLMYKGFGWGIDYADGQCTSYGWVDPINAIISNPKYCTEPADLTYKGSYTIKEMNKGTLIPVRRVTTVEVVG